MYNYDKLVNDLFFYFEALKEIKFVSSKSDKKEERLKMIKRMSIEALNTFEEQA